jgi:hypothetical protein
MAAFMHQPAQHLGGAIAGVRGQALGLDAELFGGALDHGLGRGDLRLPHRRRRLDIHDDGAFEVDQIVGAVGVESRAARGRRPAGGGIDG